MRRLAAGAVKRALGRVAIAPGPPGERTRRVLAGSANVIFCHYVGPPACYYQSFYTGLDAAGLDRDLAMLSRWFTFAPLEDVVSGSARPRAGRPPLAVTFDDGFDMSDGTITSVLARHGVRATVFVITGCVDNRDLMWRNKISATLAGRPGGAVVEAYRLLAAAHGLPPVRRAAEVLDASREWDMAAKDALADELWQRSGMPPLPDYLDRQRPYFTWDGLRGWMAAGHAVGLHTHTHPYCARLGPSALEAEIVAPAALLRRELGLTEVPLSYPFGERLPAAVERRLVEDGVVSAALGIEGFSSTGTPSHRLERATLEGHARWEVFGRTLLRSLR